MASAMTFVLSNILCIHGEVSEEEEYLPPNLIPVLLHPLYMLPVKLISDALKFPCNVDFSTYVLPPMLNSFLEMQI